MNRTETANLLTAMAAYDRRTLGTADVVAWQSLLTDVEFEDALEAVKRHYAEHTDWMMPAHVRRLVRDVVRERESAANPWAAGRYGVPKGEALPELPRGERLTAGDISPRIVELLSQLRAELPDAPRERLFPRRTAWEQAQRAFQRLADATPNPRYRPNAAVDPLADAPMPTAVRGGLQFGRSGLTDRIGRLAESYREKCRAAGAHDDGKHTDECPDSDPLPPEAYDVTGTHRHRASCYGEAGELLCGGAD